MDILKFNGYEGTAEIDMDRGVCRGKILFINDLVTYEADSPKELYQEFKSAVEDYLETCKLLGRKPQSPLKGQFNVRLTAELHRQLAVRATADGTSLNDVVGRACEAYVCQKEVNHHHNHHVVLVMENAQLVSRKTSSASSLPNWESRRVNYAH